MTGLLPLLTGSGSLRHPNFNTVDKFLIQKGLLENRNCSAAVKPWTPAMDVAELENKYVIQAEVPGLDKEDIEVTITHGLLTVKGEKAREELEENTLHIGERRFGVFSKSLRVPDSVDLAGVTATTKNGVLTITLPKAAEEKPRQITVQE